MKKINPNVFLDNEKPKHSEIGFHKVEPMKKKNHHVTFRMSDEQKKAFDQLKKQGNYTTSELIRIALYNLAKS